MTQEEADALARQNAATWKAQADNGAAMLAFMQQQAAQLHTPDQSAYLSLYEMHLKARLGPSVVTTNTGDTVMQDMVRDAVMMTEAAWPLLEPRLAALA